MKRRSTKAMGEERGRTCTLNAPAHRHTDDRESERERARSPVLEQNEKPIHVMKKVAKERERRTRTRAETGKGKENTRVHTLVK